MRISLSRPTDVYSCFMAKVVRRYARHDTTWRHADRVLFIQQVRPVLHPWIRPNSLRSYALKPSGSWSRNSNKPVHVLRSSRIVGSSRHCLDLSEMACSSPWLIRGNRTYGRVVTNTVLAGMSLFQYSLVTLTFNNTVARDPWLSTLYDPSRMSARGPDEDASYYWRSLDLRGWPVSTFVPSLRISRRTLTASVVDTQERESDRSLSKYHGSPSFAVSPG